MCALISMSFFELLLKIKLVPIFHISSIVFFQPVSLAFKEPPNKARSGLVGVCAVFKHFSLGDHHLRQAGF